MPSLSEQRELIRARLEDEKGTLFSQVGRSIAMLYPSPYHVGMSSLGYQTLYRVANESNDFAAHRAFIPKELGVAESHTEGMLLTYEAQRPIGDYPVLAISVSYELEIVGVIQLLRLAGLDPLAEARKETDPFVLIGGPITFSNPLPLADFADAILMGECDDTFVPAVKTILDCSSKEDAKKTLKSTQPHAFIPSIDIDKMPEVGKAADRNLPAYSQIITPHTELRNMFLIEPERGCHRGCAYCVMRRSTNGGMRLVKKDRLFELLPNDVSRVGLVGAATTDHPEITSIVNSLADRGLEVGLSSLRADRLTDDFVVALKRAGQRVLTTASDGASESLRSKVRQRTSEEILLRAAKLCAAHRMKRLKLYMMIGLPDETDEDIDELIRFSLEVSQIVPLSLGIAPFCAKRNTPLDGAPFAGIQKINQRLKRLRHGIKGRVDIRPTSARWAWVEYIYAQGGRAEGRATLQAMKAGGRFRDYERAFQNLPLDRPRRQLVKPGNRVLLKKKPATL